MYGTERCTGYGYSIWEMSVIGTAVGAPVAPDPKETEEAPQETQAGGTIPGGSGDAGNDDPAQMTGTSYLLSFGRPAYASTIESGDVAGRMTDGNYATSWKSVNGNLGTDRTREQWFDVDLGASAKITDMIIDWTANNTYSTDFDVQVSEDELTWTTIRSIRGSNGGKMVSCTYADGNHDNFPEVVLTGLEARGRYVRVYSYASSNNLPIQVREFQIYGEGGKNPRPSSAVDLAAGAAVSASSTSLPWWASSPNQLAAPNGVDGNYDTYWLSDASVDYNDAWYQVDLGGVHKIGKVKIQWQVEFGRVYKLQTSVDGTSWKDVYVQTYGIGEDEIIELCEDVRYVRMQGVAMGRGSGYSIREINVYEWQQGDVAQTPALDSLTEFQIIPVGQGSYVTGDYTMAQPRYPEYHTSNMSIPIPSNDWWTSVLYTRLSDGIPTLPYRMTYTETGLGLYYASDLFTSPNNGGMDSKDENDDLTITTSIITGRPEARADGYGDWSVNVQYSDEANVPKMMTTIVKGSPYLYNTFLDPSSAEISVTGLMGFFNLNGNPILTEDSQSVVTDFIGVTTKYKVTSPEENQQFKYHQYGLFLPEGTTVTRLGGKLKIQLGSNQNYLVVGIIPSTDKFDANGRDMAALQELYAHAYAYITDTEVSYDYNELLATITTTYSITTQAKRAGFSDQTLIGLLPTQWKYATSATAAKLAENKPVYHSARGLVKTIAANVFTSADMFNGVIPVFAEPVESANYDREAMLEYLNMFVESVRKDYWVADPYYMYYSESWGTISGDGGDHGMAMNLSDHHFLWAYFIFPAAVLGSYDKQFVEDYGDMINLLVRDCMNPDKNDAMLPWMRNFDPYEGHFWAGGYGDNQSGNNQESASEATFAWAGLYLWGVVTGNKAYRDAGIWGYTQEINAIEQYWFNYDQDNWDSVYSSGGVGMVWGSSYTNGTYFSGNPSCIYGIHMLPVTGALSYLGVNREANQAVWARYLVDQYNYQMKLKARTEDPNDEYYGRDYTTIDPEGWYHILWPYQALGDVDAVLANMDVKEFPNDELFNSYWFIMNMDAKGYVAPDVWASNWTAYEVFKTEDGKYTATVWNPTDATIYVEFANASGKIGSAYISAHATTSVNPFADTPASETERDYVEADIENKAINLPNMLQAEDYYTNFGCSVWSDTTEGYYVGSINVGSKLVYDVNVAETATYQLGMRAMNYNGAPVTVQILDAATDSLIATVVIPAGETNAWTTTTTTIDLTAGRQKLKVNFLNGNVNFNWFDIYPVGGTPNYNKFDPTVADPYKNIAPQGTAIVSSFSGDRNGAAAIDNNMNTRWETVSGVDPQWITFEFDDVYKIDDLIIDWETAAAKGYRIEVSKDGENWRTIYNVTDGKSGESRIIDLDYCPPGVADTTEEKTWRGGRYLRIYGTARTTGYGYSIWETRVFGTQIVENGDSEDNPQMPEPIVEPQAVNLNKLTASMKVGETLILLAEVTPADAADKSVTWKSGNTAVAVVSDGVVTAKAAGTATITVTTVNGQSQTESCPAPLLSN